MSPYFFVLMAYWHSNRRSHRAKDWLNVFRRVAHISVGPCSYSCSCISWQCINWSSYFCRAWNLAPGTVPALWWKEMINPYMRPQDCQFVWQPSQQCVICMDYSECQTNKDDSCLNVLWQEIKRFHSGTVYFEENANMLTLTLLCMLTLV